ncbi:hypothetical protein BDV40DRAFT_262145 [Aspergillus tamarii]|uniref:Uncharacterized protein n=1 Tax=Aspergillus tamarii TaxID=41984 RepID=A0A5N6UYU1_ASPTM|nr:hypothetical protein BDV40DRAFT_262145 [Aspergillus tamarii]
MSFTSQSLRKTHIDSLLFFFYSIIFSFILVFDFLSFWLHPAWLTKYHRHLLLDRTRVVMLLQLTHSL